MCVGAGGLYKAKGRSLELDLTPWITQPTCLGGQADCKVRGKESRGPAEASFIIYSAKVVSAFPTLRGFLFFAGGVLFGGLGGMGVSILSISLYKVCVHALAFSAFLLCRLERDQAASGMHKYSQPSWGLRGGIMGLGLFSR